MLFNYMQTAYKICEECDEINIDKCRCCMHNTTKERGQDGWEHIWATAQGIKDAKKVDIAGILQAPWEKCRKCEQN